MSSYANHLFISILVQLILFLILVTNHVIHSWTQIIICWIICGSFITAALYLIKGGRARPVYLIGFSCYKPRESLKFTREAFVGRAIEVGTFTDENIQFQKRMLERSGLGQATYFPEGVAKLPPDLSILEARREGEEVMFGAVDELIKNTGIKLHNIGILIVNCSLFSPTPSLSDMIMNRYKLREDIVTYNLSGMGCSAGIISVDLARHFLKVHSNSYALIVSTENITQNGYYGNQRSMLVTNCLFRMGGAAVLLSNHPSERTHAKYVLSDLIRTHKGAHDESFTCVTQEEDDKGKVGVSLSKDLMAVAGEALKANITTLGPRVLPLSEQLRFLVTFIRRKVLNAKVAPYVPNFKLAFEHFCIHAGGRAILDELEKRLQLTEWHMEPSRMALCRFGNTSSSSLWYELAYSEAKKRVKKGDRVWQIGFGSGFKCNSMVWKALKDVQPIERYPWMDVIDEFPVHVPRVAKIDM